MVMVLDTVILPGVDPPDILRKTMNYSICMASIPAVIFIISELISGQFAGYKFQSFSSNDMLVLFIAFISFVAVVPITFWINSVGVSKVATYLSRNGQILERQLMGALVRVFRSSQITRMNLLFAGTTVGMVDAVLSRSLLGLGVYLLGQFLLIYFLPWPARTNLWIEIKRREVLS